MSGWKMVAVAVDSSLYAELVVLSLDAARAARANGVQSKVLLLASIGHLLLFELFDDIVELFES